MSTRYATSEQRPRSSSPSPADVEMEKHSGQENGSSHVSLGERLCHTTWAVFTFPMSTGGLAVLLAETPHRFPGLDTIGKVVFVFDLVGFTLCCSMIGFRFLRRSGSLAASLMHPTESLFFPTFLLALVNVLNGIQIYGVPACGPWLVVAMRVLFWIYVALVFTNAALQYLYLFSAHPHRLTVQSMTPAWILPVFPAMITGTLATLVAPSQPPAAREPIVLAGLTFQGLGWMVTFMMYSVYLNRLMQFGLPAPDLRPGMFIAVGSPAFTAVALIGLSQAMPAEWTYFAARPGVLLTLQTVADFAAVFLWCLSFWFFAISLLAVLGGARRMSFHLVWWAFVFPNVGFTLATSSIGTRFQSQGVLWVASAMTVLLVVAWLFVLVCHVRAVVKKEIMMPGKDEDKDEYKDNDRKLDIPVPPSPV